MSKLTFLLFGAFFLSCSIVQADPTATERTHYVLGGRFQVTVLIWNDGQTVNKDATPSIYDPEDPSREFDELTSVADLLSLTKVGITQYRISIQDSCDASGSFTVSILVFDDVEIEFIVRDNWTNNVRVYYSPPTTPFAMITDFEAFATCGAVPDEYVIDLQMEGFNQGQIDLLTSRGISGEYIIHSYNWDTNEFTYLGENFHRDTGAVDGSAIDSPEKLYDKDVWIARSTSPYKFEDPDEDGSLNIADLDPFNPDIQ